MQASIVLLIRLLGVVAIETFHKIFDIVQMLICIPYWLCIVCHARACIVLVVLDVMGVFGRVLC